MSQFTKKISIVVPVYFSAKFLDQLLLAIDDQKKESNWNLELILVDDGSTDGSFEVIEKLKEEYNYIKGIKLSRNFGHQIAVKTGLSFCTGDYIAIIDDDLQDPPSLLPRFFELLDQGNDVVYGIRKKRKENYWKKLSYSIFYRILQKISSTKIPLDSGDFCVMTKRVVDHMLTFPEQNPFLRGIRAWVGFKQIGLEYERQERVAGESGYTLKKLFKIAFDGIFSFSSIPIKIISICGYTGLLFSISYIIYLLIKYFFVGIATEGFTTLIVIMLVFSSFTLICLGIIGEYIVRIYNEVRARPYTIIEKTI